MEICFRDKEIENLYYKGFSKNFPTITTDVIIKLRVSLSYSRMATCIGDLQNRNLIYFAKCKDESYVVELGLGWKMCLNVKFGKSEELNGNLVEVLSLENNNSLI